MRIVSTSRLRDVVRSTFWVIPAACVAGSIALAVGLIVVDQRLGSSHAFLPVSRPPFGGS